MREKIQLAFFEALDGACSDCGDKPYSARGCGCSVRFADALLATDGPIAAMQAEHQREIERLTNALKAALPAVMVFNGPRSDERLHLVEAQLAQYEGRFDPCLGKEGE